MHIIRLRHPWQAEPAAALEPAIAAAQPEHFDSDPAIAYRRNFHRPTGLGDDALHLNIAIVAQAPVRLLAWLNDQALPLGDSQDGILRSDITGLVEPFNTLRIDVRGLPSPSGSLNESSADAFPRLSEFAEVELQIGS